VPESPFRGDGISEVLRALRFMGGGGAGFFARDGGGGGGAFRLPSTDPVSDGAQLDTLEGVLPCDVVGESDLSWRNRSVRSGL
jgi:hypothetical protein